MAQDSENTVVYITEKGQICYDRIEPKDLSTARSRIGKQGKNKDAMRAAAEKNKLWPKSKLRLFFMERNRYENQLSSGLICVAIMLTLGLKGHTKFW